MREVGQPENGDRRGRAGFVDRRAVEIIHRADFSVHFAGHQRVAHMQGSILHQQRGDRALRFIQLGFDHAADQCSRGVGEDFRVLGGEHHGFEQVLHAGPLLGGDRDDQSVAAVIVGNQAEFR